jgi:hypothetical protein|eukprot:5390185-Prymnesium_polylepis.1
MAESRAMARAAATHNMYLDAAMALRDGRIKFFWLILRQAESFDSQMRTALCTFEDDGETILSVAIDTEKFDVAEQLLDMEFTATEDWASKQARTVIVGVDCLWNSMVHTNPTKFDQLEYPWKDRKAFWARGTWSSKGGVFINEEDSQRNDAQEAIIAEALTKPLPMYLYSLGCRRMQGSDREQRAARDAFTYGTWNTVQELWMRTFSPYAFNSCFMFYSREKDHLF